jgi:hypothetical protein
MEPNALLGAVVTEDSHEGRRVRFYDDLIKAKLSRSTSCTRNATASAPS